MGERHGDGGFPDRRVVHPASPASDEPALEALLAAAMRGHADDADAEAQAVAAFRAARDSGAHAARSRRRDDWRPREQRRVRRSAKATFGVLLASVTLGGVAVAAIGSSSHGEGDNGGGSRTQPSSSAPDSSAAGSDGTGSQRPGSSASGASAHPSAHPSQAQDTAAHCRAYEKVVGRGKALDSTAWQRLVSAAGGEDKVAAYCAEQTGQDTKPTQKAKATPSAAATATPTSTSTSTSTSNSGNGNGKGKGKGKQ
ncbi:hypothetical protein OG762_16880 [Streptomyces sp. NBC_01136]|uniref:hypothetical protein n=1 Tax=unclassified Streptomyces TaxID=2593676 RepID=UPI0032563385|nr:hypothetical protein OG762_16880 [Streptomyces sp. NBC_01136]